MHWLYNKTNTVDSWKTVYYKLFPYRWDLGTNTLVTLIGLFNFTLILLKMDYLKRISSRDHFFLLHFTLFNACVDSEAGHFVFLLHHVCPTNLLFLGHIFLRVRFLIILNFLCTWQMAMKKTQYRQLQFVHHRYSFVRDSF